MCFLQRNFFQIFIYFLPILVSHSLSGWEREREKERESERESERKRESERERESCHFYI